MLGSLPSICEEPTAALISISKNLCVAELKMMTVLCPAWARTYQSMCLGLSPDCIADFRPVLQGSMKAHGQSNETKDALTCGACPTTHRSPMVWSRSRLVPSRRRGTAQKTEPQCKRGHNSTSATKPPSHFFAVSITPKMQ